MIPAIEKAEQEQATMRAQIDALSQQYNMEIKPDRAYSFKDEAAGTMTVVQGGRVVTYPLPTPEDVERLDTMMQEAEPIGSTVKPSPEYGGAAVGSADELLAEFEDQVVVPRVVMDRQFYISQLSVYELIDVETRRLSVERGKVVRRPDQEAKLGLALEFAACLMQKDGDGYKPLFSLEDAQNFLRKPKAMPLINALANAIHEVNPDLDPALRVEAHLQSLQSQNG